MRPLDLRRLTSRVAAVGLLLGALAAFHAFAVEPIFATHRSLDDSLARTAELVARYEGVAADHQAIQAKIRGLLRRQTTSGVYLDGTTDALAAAKLQQIVATRINANRGQTRSIRTFPAKPEEGLTRVSIQVQFEAPIDALQRIVHAFETNRPFVFIRELEIRGRSRGRTVREEVDTPLLVHLRLDGYMRPDSET